MLSLLLLLPLPLPLLLPLLLLLLPLLLLLLPLLLPEVGSQVGTSAEPLADEETEMSAAGDAGLGALVIVAGDAECMQALCLDERLDGTRHAAIAESVRPRGGLRAEERRWGWCALVCSPSRSKRPALWSSPRADMSVHE